MTAGSVTLLRDLRDEVPLERVEAVLRGFGALTGADRSMARLREVTRPGLDLGRATHRRALLAWLRAWGCRHLRVADDAGSSRSLASWWRRFGASLPGPRHPLIDLTDRELEAAAAAYGALATAPAASRASAGGPVGVSFGETGSAKALFAIRPLAFAPWDTPIRVALGLAGPAGYRAYLEDAADALRGLAARLDVEVSALPLALGRPEATPPKLVDEYLWMRVNRDR